MPCIYKLVNNINGKFYVGKTKDIKKRFSQHKRMATHRQDTHLLYNSMKKYGIENFSLEIIEECSEQDLSEREIFWIRKLQPHYNVTSGGDGGDTFKNRSEHSKQNTRNLLSNKMKKKWQDPEYREQMSLNTKERWQDPEYREEMHDMISNKWKDPEYINKHSLSLKLALSSPEKRKIWSECKKGKNNVRWLGKVILLDPLGNSVEEFENSSIAAKSLGMASHNIRDKAKSGEPIRVGKLKGYTFNFVKD